MTCPQGSTICRLDYFPTFIWLAGKTPLSMALSNVLLPLDGLPTWVHIGWLSQMFFGLLAHMGPPWATFLNMNMETMSSSSPTWQECHVIWRWRIVDLKKTSMLPPTRMRIQQGGRGHLVIPMLQEDGYIAKRDRITRPSSRSHLVVGYRQPKGGSLHHRWCWLEEGGLRLETEDPIAKIANLKEDAYVHCPQLEGTLKIFEDLGVFNFDNLRVLNLKDLDVFNFADLRVFGFKD